MAAAARIARAGPSKVARKPSPVVSISRPRNRARFGPDHLVVLLQQSAPPPVAELAARCRGTHDVGEQHGEDDPVGLGLGTVPVRNSCVRASTVSWSPKNGKWSSPGSSTKVAEGSRSAMYRLARTSVARSPDRCSTSVGTRTAGEEPADVDRSDGGDLVHALDRAGGRPPVRGPPAASRRAFGAKETGGLERVRGTLAVDGAPVRCPDVRRPLLPRGSSGVLPPSRRCARERLDPPMVGRCRWAMLIPDDGGREATSASPPLDSPGVLVYESGGEGGRP